MVRLLVGAMVAVLESKLDPARFKDLVMNNVSEKVKYMAPACGLYLAGVSYERNMA
jgi:tRNA U38,U39,U40 pseudouridine synthase TruA